MNEDLGKALKQITEMLSQDKGGDTISSLLSLLGSSGDKEGDVKSDGKAEEGNKENSSSRDNSQDNIEMVRQITGIMNKLNTKNDPRVHLLHALKPFLNKDRQKKLSNCIMVLQVTSLMRTADE